LITTPILKGANLLTSHFEQFDKYKVIIKRGIIVVVILTGALIATSYYLSKEIDNQKHEIAALRHTQAIEIQNQIKLKHMLLEREKENISLRNSEQIISNRGADPINCTTLPVREDMIPITKGEYLGQWFVTFYTICPAECGNSRGITSSGERAIPGYTAAIDSSYWGYNMLLYVDGYGVIKTNDTGNKVKGKYRIDICVANKTVAYQIGEGMRKVWLVQNN